MADPVVAEYARAAEHYDEKWAFYVEATTRERALSQSAHEGCAIFT